METNDEERAMRERDFTLVLRTQDLVEAESAMSRLEARDFTVSERHESICVDYLRRAPSFDDAVQSAKRELDLVGLGYMKQAYGVGAGV
jgi:hypothetical protein